MPDLIASSIDLLVHPFYEISKLGANFNIDLKSEHNIWRLRRIWKDSISRAAQNPRRNFAIVNSLEPDKSPRHEYSNPFRNFFQGIVEHANQALEDRLFYFNPSVSDENIVSEEISPGIRIALNNGNSFFYNPPTFIIFAYGESMGVCVDSNARKLAECLKINERNVRIVPNKSLPSRSLFFIPGEGYFIPNEIYLTVEQLADYARLRRHDRV